MINSLKTVAVFGCTFTSRYRRGLCAAFSRAADELGINLVYFNSLGKIGDRNSAYGIHESDIIEYVDLSTFSGAIFDGEGYTIDSVRDRVIERLKASGIPVVSVSSHVDDFYNVEFDDVEGIAGLIEHLMDHHGYTKIGFMSGYLSHPDAQVRLKKFREIMRSRGLPEDGAGMFEGDFWFNKGGEAADFFLSLDERPEAVVCANDFMAVALVKALSERGIDVPKDIAVTGFDGTLEGKECLPHITSATRERYDIAKRSLKLLVDISNGREADTGSLHIIPTPIYTHSCGCMPLDYKKEALSNNSAFDTNRIFSYNLYGTESSILQLNHSDSLEKVEELFRTEVFKPDSVNFGDYLSYFVMLHCDENGRQSCKSDYLAPSGKFRPAIWIDNEDEYIRPEGMFDSTKLIPDAKSDKPHFYVVMSVHCSERPFGYSLIEMKDYDIFNEFYNVWLLILAMQLETLLKNDRINKLIGRLEDLSISDGLTGMLNRRGFEELSRDSLRQLKGEHNVCTMVIDLDGLKRINDIHGHYEGDFAIKAVAEIITQCCVSGEIAGRTGGDEFYVYSPDYTEEKLIVFMRRMNSLINNYNSSFGKPYRIEVSFGASITAADCRSSLEDLMKISDERMYAQKQAKPNRRKN